MSKVKKLIADSQLRRRVQTKLSSKKMTDQSFAKSQDINNIMAQYQKTGILPDSNASMARYVDNTGLPSLEEAHEQIKTAESMFMSLPSQIRKQMDNDPKNLVGFIQNPENHEQLIKAGILEKRPQKAPEFSKENSKPKEPEATQKNTADDSGKKSE